MYTDRQVFVKTWFSMSSFGMGIKIDKATKKNSKKYVYKNMKIPASSSRMRLKITVITASKKYIQNRWKYHRFHNRGISWNLQLRTNWVFHNLNIWNSSWNGNCILNKLRDSTSHRFDCTLMPCLLYHGKIYFIWM